MSADIDLRVQRELKRFKRRAARMAQVRAAEGLFNGIISQLQPGAIAMDCGANLGVVSSRIAATGADVMSFEPDPYAFEQLQAAAVTHPNIQPINAAVGAQPGELTLWRAVDFDSKREALSQSSTLIPGGKNIDESTGITVKVLSLPDIIEDELTRRLRIDFLKIDIEGAEIDLLNALEDRGLLSYIGMTVAETHEKKFPELAEQFAALRGRLSQAHPPHRVCLDWI